MSCEVQKNKIQSRDGELISVLVALYNVEPFVSECVESLFQQTYRNLEFIFINDASTDNTAVVLQKLVKKYRQRAESVKVVNNLKNCGLSTVRNIALSVASGDYVFFVDGDDFLETDAIARLYKKSETSNADIVVGDFFTEYKKFKVEYKHQKDLSNEQYFFGVIQRSIPCCIWGKLIRRDLFVQNQIKGIDEVQFGEDFAIVTRLIYKAQKIAFLGHPVYHYRKTNQQSITKNLNERSVDDLLKVNEVLFNYFLENREINNQLKLSTKLILLKQLPSVKLLKFASKIYPELIISRSLGFKDRLVLALAEGSHFALLLCLNRVKFRLNNVRNFIFRC